MQSSRNTTENPSAEQLYAALTRKLKKTSAKITERKLASGEYVRHEGKIVPASLVQEKAGNAQVGTQRQVIAGRAKWVEKKFRAQKRTRVQVGETLVVRVGITKTPAAASIEATIRPPLKVAVAPGVSIDGSQIMPTDGQMYAYDAQTQQMVPMNRVLKRNRPIAPRRQSGVRMSHKAK